MPSKFDDSGPQKRSKLQDIISARRKYGYIAPAPGKPRIATFPQRKPKAPKAPKAPKVLGNSTKNPGFIGPTIAESKKAAGIKGPYTKAEKGVNPKTPVKAVSSKKPTKKPTGKSTSVSKGHYKGDGHSHGPVGAGGTKMPSGSKAIKPAAGKGSTKKAAPKKGSSAYDKAKRDWELANNPALAELQRQLEAQGKDYNKNSNEVAKKGQMRESDLEALYATLAGNTDSLRQTQDRNFDNTERSVGNNYGKLQQQLEQTYGQQKSNTQSELDRLGIQAAGPAATQEMSRDQEFLKGLTGVNASNANANLNSQQTSFDGLMRMLQGNASTEGTVQQGQTKRDTAKTLADMLAEFTTNKNSLSGKRGDILAGKGAGIQQLRDLYEAQEAAAQAAAQQQAFERAMAEANFGLKAKDIQFDNNLAAQRFGYTQSNDAANRALKEKLAAQQKTSSKPPSGLAGALSLLPNGPKKQRLIDQFQYLMSGQYYEKLPNGEQSTGKARFSADDPFLNQHLKGWLTRNPDMNQGDVEAILRSIIAYNGKIGNG